MAEFLIFAFGLTLGGLVGVLVSVALALGDEDDDGPEAVEL